MKLTAGAGACATQERARWATRINSTALAAGMLKSDQLLLV